MSHVAFFSYHTYSHILHLYSFSMAVILLLFIFLVLNGLPTTYSTYEYFKFVQQWPKTYCDGQLTISLPCTRSAVNYFTIHGLWPANNSVTQLVENCPGTQFDFKLIAALESQLDVDWLDFMGKPNFVGNKNREFWKYQWNKHGRCSAMNFKEFDYFNLAIDKKRQTNLMSILASSKIVPDPIKSYSEQSIIKAIKSKTGYEPELNCRTDKNTKYLKEIRLCLEANGSNYKQCTYRGNCGPRVIWPTI